MLRKFALILAAGSAIFFSAAYALGLGEIDVNSHLNQKFSAVIPLNSISAEDAENLLVRLADSDDFNKAGIERADYLSSLNFQTVTDAKGSRIVISSKQLAREPFLSFLLDVRSSTGRVLREYTVLLDPPAYAQTAPAAATPAPVAKAPSDFYQTAEEANQAKPAASVPAPVAAAPKSVPKPAPAASTPAPVAAAPAADSASDASPSVAYGPVKAQETFWSIAAKLRPNPSVTMDQMLWALYNNNPQAFEGNRISGLLKGSTLKVPALSTITAVSPVAAKEHLQALQGHRTATPKKAAPEKVAPVVSAEEAPAAPVAAPKAAPAVAPKSVSKAAAPAVPEKKTPEAVAPPPPVAAPAKPAAPAPPAPVVKAPPPAAIPPPAPPATPEPAAAAPAPAAAMPDQSSSATPTAVPAEPEPEAPVEPVKPTKAKKSAEPSSSALADDWMAPALAGAVVLILALLGVRFWQKKQAEKDDSAAPVLTSKASSNLQFWKRAAESAPAAAPSKFVVPPPPVPSARKAEPAVAKPVQAVPPAPPKQSNPLWDDTSTQQVAVAPAAAFDLTQTLDRHSELESKFAEPEVDEFNTTNQFDSQTLKVDAEANDPVSEADFHLAYGLYDEAALLLESAAEKNPGRSDIRVKLAETYFRANKPHEFDDVAQSLKPHLDAVEWQKIAIMGSQLLPDSPLYKGAAGAAMDDSVDLAFDEPIDLGAAETKIFSTTSTSIPSARSNSSVLDFKLEDLEAPQVAKPAPTAPAAAPTGNTVEFDLADFDLSSPPAKKPSATPAIEAPAPVAEPAKASNAVEFDLGGFDLEPAKQAGEAEALGEDINLDDFDLGELAEDSHAISAGDEAGTKLDLARAYVDMGDNDMARSLLTEVLVQGSEDQKTEAQALIQRLA